MLDDIERRRFLVQPAREHPLPAAVGALDIELDERPGQGLALPRRGRFARAQADDRVADPDRLTGPQREVADDAVALVQQAEDRDPLGHRRHPGLPGLRPGGVKRHRLPGRLALGLGIAIAAARGERRRNHKSYRRAHAQSGVQG